MTTTLPTWKTRQPARAGLLFHEILADGLIHAAAVFGIQPDERFVERIANLAWSNGVAAINCDVQQAAALAQTLGEALEAGRRQTQSLCLAVQAAAAGEENVFDAIRGHYAASGSRELDAANPAHADAIRQQVGEAVMAGISCRGLAPALHRAVTDFNDRARLEQQFLCEMLPRWMLGNGLPGAHPIIQMADRFYAHTPVERQLMRELIGQALHVAVETDDPWNLDFWLARGWKSGIVQAKFAPDSVTAVFRDVTATNLADCRRLHREHLVPHATGPGQPDLRAAFNQHLAECHELSLHLPEIQAHNPRLLAVRALDFTAWMAFCTELPEEPHPEESAA